VAMLAHELRNPLAPILSAAALLEAREGVDPSLARHHAMIAEQARHMARLLDDLLEVSRVVRGTVVLRRESLDLREVVSSVVRTLAEYLNARGLQFDLSLPEVPVLMHGDPTRMHQVVTNLVHNALKFTDDGGRISVTLRSEAGEATLSVRDTGRGIAPHALSTIFELFAQEEQGLARTHGGLGVGLTVVRGLVELHGGRVEARSEGAGRGAEFIVHLPVQPSDPAVTHDVPAATNENARARRVLVVDDNPAAANSLAELAEIWGHDAQALTSGSAALQAVQDLRPDVIVLDIGMPDMDGYEVARRLREEAGYTGRLIALSGYAQQDDRLRASASGFDHHLAKPVEPETLKKLLEEES
jgi:CheY-like chemotaxis protein